MDNKHGHINLPPPLPPLPPPPKPRINMDALQKATGIIAGLVALSPIGRLVELGVVSIADAASHGEASKFINNGHAVNTTLNLLPGGMLAQQVANDSSNGLVGSTLQKFVPDPKKMVIHDVMKIGETIVLHPSQTVNVGKNLGNSNYHDLHDIVDNYGNVVKKEKPTINHYILPIVDKIKKIVQVPHKDDSHHPIQTTLRKMETIISKKETTLPKKEISLPKIETILSHLIQTTLHKIETVPKIETILSHPIQTTLHNVETTLPKKETSLPKVETTIPKMQPTIKPSHMVMKNTISNIAPIPSYTEPSPISVPFIGLGLLCLAAFVSR